MRRFLCSVVLFLGLNTQGQFAVAEESVRVVTENWYPYNYLDDRNNITGISTSYVKELLDEAQLNYSIELLPWSRAINLATSYANVLIYTLLRTPERENQYHWLCPVAPKATHQIYKLRKNKAIKIESEKDLKRYTIALTRDSFLHNYMRTLGFVEGVNLQITADDRTNTTLFLANRVDLLAGLDGNIQKLVGQKTLDKRDLVSIFKVPEERYPDYCLGLSLSTSEILLTKLRQAHQRLQKHSTYNSPILAP